MAFAAINSAPNNDPVIYEAFSDDTPLRSRVYAAIARSPQDATLFTDISRHMLSLRTRLNALPQQQQQPASQGHITQVLPAAAKKRKVGSGSSTNGADASVLADLTADVPLQLYVQDMSFAIPQRKKLRLELTRLDVAARSSETTAVSVEFLRARNQASGFVEFGVPLDKIRHVLCLPVPEKTQRQCNFCVIPEYGDGVTPVPDDQTVFEPMVWTVPDGPPRTAFLGSGTPVMESSSLAETYPSYLRHELDKKLKGTKVICPNDNEFASPIPETHRKSEKAYHVKAFRGSKEGYLFFLSTGIFFGFKKPLLFFAFENIESISYTSVLQRTFNLSIVVSATGSDKTTEFELSMIDQSNYHGIDEYIKRHGLQNASLAEARRARKANTNGNAPAEAAANSGGDTGESELQRAQRELEDREDEEEEDYDPGSDGDSDGSGSDSEDSADNKSEAVDGKTDLMQDELGSEAEMDQT